MKAHTTRLIHKHEANIDIILYFLLEYHSKDSTKSYTPGFIHKHEENIDIILCVVCWELGYHNIIQCVCCKGNMWQN